MINKQYWFCLIGPTDRDRLPAGSDAPLRNGKTHGTQNRI